MVMSPYGCALSCSCIFEGLFIFNGCAPSSMSRFIMVTVFTAELDDAERFFTNKRLYGCAS